MSSSEKPVSLVLAGIGGMGGVYLKALLENPELQRYRIAGVVDPCPENCPVPEQLAESRDEPLRRKWTPGQSPGPRPPSKIPVFPGLADFYRNAAAELAIISSPIQFHADQTCLALRNGSHVLCEKPVAATIQEARRMSEASRHAGRWVAIGYQWSFSDAIQALKSDILAGRFGAPRRLKCLYLWPRDRRYYRRNTWAGRRQDAGGAWILDSPANNAMAHDLHNMFYLLGGDATSAASPVDVEAELYRAYEIENFDTAAARIHVTGGAEILFLVTHVPLQDRGPVYHFEFERGEVSGSGRSTGIQARFENGEVREYGAPDLDPMKKLWDCLAAVRSGRKPVCGVDASLSQTLALDGMQDSMPAITPFPAGWIHRETKGAAERLWVEGLDAALERCYETYRLPSESGIPWSRKGRRIDLHGYDWFPGGSAE